MKRQTAAMIVLVCSIILYGVFQARTLIIGPTIQILEPAAHESVERITTLHGIATKAVYLSVNDQRVYPNRDGFFRQDLLLPEGYSIVEVYARNRHQRETTIHIPLRVTPYDTSKENKTTEEG